MQRAKNVLGDMLADIQERLVDIRGALTGLKGKGVTQKVALAAAASVLGFCSCCGTLAIVGAATGGADRPSAAHGSTATATLVPTRTPLPTATLAPTATPLPTATPVRPTATPTPQIAMIGGLKAPFDVKYGTGIYSSGDIAWEYHYDSPTDNRVLWLTLDSSVSDPNSARVVHMEVGVTETWTDQTAAAHCRAFLPPDAQYQQKVITAGGPDYEVLYTSRMETSLLTPDYFTDASGNQVPPGTVYVQYFHDGNSYITGCTLGLGDNN